MNRDEVKKRKSKISTEWQKKRRKIDEEFRKKGNDRTAKHHKENSRKLKDTYIKKELVRRTSLYFKDVPDDLVELKRVQLQLHRLIREKKNVSQ